MSILFDLPISAFELRRFRGAVISNAGREWTKFHNHSTNGYIYSYPLIQYRIVGRKAAILCINDGIEDVQQLFTKGFVGKSIDIGREQKVDINLLSVRQAQYYLDIVDEPIEYRISNWLSLNQDNFKVFNSLENDEQRLEMLNKILVANILSFAKGIGWHIDKKIECHIEPQSIESHSLTYKHQKFRCFRLQFKSNVLLPPKIGLGKGVSFNHGIISILPNSEEEQ